MKANAYRISNRLTKTEAQEARITMETAEKQIEKGRI